MFVRPELSARHATAEVEPNGGPVPKPPRDALDGLDHLSNDADHVLPGRGHGPEVLFIESPKCSGSKDAPHGLPDPPQAKGGKPDVEHAPVDLGAHAVDPPHLDELPHHP